MNSRARRTVGYRRGIQTRIAGFTAIVALGCAAAPAAAETTALDRYESLPFSFPVTKRIQPVDVNGDGLKDILTAADKRLFLYLQNPKGETAFDFSQADGILELPGRATGWTLDRLPGQTGPKGGRRILALVDGKRVMSWRLKAGDFAEPETLVDSAAGTLPTGAYPMGFVRDINGDGLNDLIVPGPETLQLYLQTRQGGYEDGFQVQSRMSSYSRLAPRGNLAERVGQRVRIPQIDIRDVNNDGRNDLITSNQQRLEVFLANDKGRFPADASYRLNLEALEERVGEVDFENIDRSNLAGLLAYTYDIQLQDVDGDKIHDLLVREAGKITLFGGTPEGMDMEKPRQILKSSGNVLGTVLRDEDEDGLKDLWLMRIEDVSLGNLFLWLAVSGSVDMETYIYRNRGERFASRPHRKITVSVKFPSILRSVDLVRGAADGEVSGGDMIRAVRAQLDGTSTPQELVALGRKSLAIFMNVVENSRDGRFLGLADYSRDKDEYVYDLGQVLKNPNRSASRDLERLRGREADFQVPFGGKGFAPDVRQTDLTARDINNDGRDDFFVLSDREEDRVRGLLLLSR